MNNELHELLINVQRNFNNGEVARKLKELQEQYKRYTEVESGFQTGFGHTFSQASLTGFEKAIKMSVGGQVESFRQCLDRLMFEKDVTQVTISRRSLIKDSTLSRYINGSRKVPAFIVFRIALAMKLNLMETETLLRRVGKGFREAEMDVIIMEAIKQGIYDVYKVEAVLRRFTNGVESLFTKREHKELGITNEDMEIDVF